MFFKVKLIRSPRVLQLSFLYQPTPLHFLDEIDVAPDLSNVSIVANYIKDCTKRAQFIIIFLW